MYQNIFMCSVLKCSRSVVLWPHSICCIIYILEVTNISEMLPKDFLGGKYSQMVNSLKVCKRIILDLIMLMLCKIVYCTDGIELFNKIFLKTSRMFNILENQDSLLQHTQHAHKTCLSPVFFSLFQFQFQFNCLAK